MMNIGLIGCGMSGKIHLSNLINEYGQDELRITSIADVNSLRLTKTGRLVPHAKQYINPIQMLNTEKLDAVFICVPPDRHGDIEMAAIRNRIAMYIEKPVSNDLHIAYKIQEAIEKYNVICSVGYQERYSSTLDIIKNQIDEEDIQFIKADWIESLSDKIWFRRFNRSGGQLVEHTTHLLDVLRYLLGEGECISCEAELLDHVSKADIHSIYNILLNFANNKKVSINSGCFIDSNFSYSEKRLYIYYRNKVLIYNWYKNTSIIEPSKTVVYNNKNDSMRLAEKMFIRAIKENNTHYIRSHYKDAIKTLKLSLDIHHNIRKCKYL